VAVHESVLVPVPLLEIWIGCAAGTVPPAVYANCKLAGITAMVEGAATMIPMVSSPVDATTWRVSRPVRLAGSFTKSPNSATM